jgi:hypothetical protein
MTDKTKVCKDCNEPDCDGDNSREFCGECGGMMILIQDKAPTALELELYKMRRHSESKDPSYCGSCSIETHVAQLRNPKSWVQTGRKMWQKDWEKKLQREQMAKLKIPSDLGKCQLMILALTSQLEEQTAINTLLEVEIKQTAKGERAADIEVDRLLHELRVIDHHWHRRFREQADDWDLRTRVIRKQLDEMVVLSAKIQPLVPVMVKRGKSQVFEDLFCPRDRPHEKPPMISSGCTWPVGNCQCMNGDQEED